MPGNKYFIISLLFVCDLFVNKCDFFNRKKHWLRKQEKYNVDYHGMFQPFFLFLPDRGQRHTGNVEYKFKF